MAPAIGPMVWRIRSAWAASSLALASAWAATIRSASISMSSGSTTLLSIRTAPMTPAPESDTLTSPLPADPSITVSANRAWASCSFCCMTWACFMIAFRSFIASPQ